MITSWTVDVGIILLLSIYFVYKYLTRNFDYWKVQDVFYFKPTSVFGNFADVFMLKKTLAEIIKSFYDKTNEPYFGVFMIDDPVLVIKSPELIKNILIKDFNYFKDRTIGGGSHNKMISNWLIFQKYPEWKKTRPKLAKIFTPVKLRTMFENVKDVGNLLINDLKENLGIIECKESARKFSIEIVARCFFGIQGKCFENKQSAFSEIGQRTFRFTLRNGLVQGLYILKPELANLFKLYFIEKSDMYYLLNIFENTFNERKAQRLTNQGKVKDYIDIMLEMEEEEKKSDLADYESAYLMAKANTVTFFLAGEETTSSAISFTLYEWAVNPQTQEKARKEIFSVWDKYGTISYESLNEMEYLGMCLAETGRMYPPLQIIDRMTTMDYRVPDTNLVIKKGTKVYIPHYALHMDSQYFPEPQKFIPERFLDKNINKEGVYYMPFGAGPRNCIGERFGLMSAKISLAMILMTFKVELCDKTPIPIKFETKSFNPVSNVGIPLRFTLLEKN